MVLDSEFRDEALEDMAGGCRLGRYKGASNVKIVYCEKLTSKG